jgi:hypothetical protein
VSMCVTSDVCRNVYVQYVCASDNVCRRVCAVKRDECAPTILCTKRITGIIESIISITEAILQNVCASDIDTEQNIIDTAMCVRACVIRERY